MALKLGSSSLSCVSSWLPSPPCRRRKSSEYFNFQLSSSTRSYECKPSEVELLRNVKVKYCQIAPDMLKANGRMSPRLHMLFSTSKDQGLCVMKSDASEREKHYPIAEDVCPDVVFEGINGRPGLISFYNRPFGKEDKPTLSGLKKKQNSVLWFFGPFVLVAAFIFPSLYLRGILSSIFEDSLLTDFLILFFTEALFYCGVAIFLLFIDFMWRPVEPAASPNIIEIPRLAYQISSVATLVLSLIIPMVTMGLVWPWTGPAASATLAPYLVGIIVQFAFEQNAKHQKSPSGPVIPIIFQVYRLHQLNRAAQLVTALSFTVRGAEKTIENLAVDNSLGTLLNVLQLLGVICIWSLSSFLMRSFPSSVAES